MTAPLRDILLKLSRREDLTRDEARDAFEQIMGGHANDAQIGGLLVGLASKGTTAEELIGGKTQMMPAPICTVFVFESDGSLLILDNALGAQSRAINVGREVFNGRLSTARRLYVDHPRLGG